MALVIRHLYIMNYYIYNEKNDTILISNIQQGSTNTSGIWREFIDITINTIATYPDQTQCLCYNDIKEFFSDNIGTITEVRKEYNNNGAIEITKKEYIGYTNDLTISKRYKNNDPIVNARDFEYIVRLYKKSESQIKLEETQQQVDTLNDTLIQMYES